ncbi:mucosal addressin cell adhesion molecule 1 [Dryobates pubescens]|uniref:mucosal addressin cell adhesion molecule 1 n=1 Tax=Dryobates pubescens TaxID=118200 RepID=UPI0023B93C04|nr:mucosal addressin cell adhesion molecule 1 [Dryobates pubescens]
MDSASLLLLLLLLPSPWGCSGRPADRLAVMPQQPVVPYGGSAQLNCSLACAGGTVQWKGLDTSLGSITSFPTHSILHISNARVATEGTKICQGTCQGQFYQRTVHLKVYALPDVLQLVPEPSALQPGQPGSLRCSAQGIYPVVGLGLTWYQGDQVLEEADLDPMETDEMLFDVDSTLSVPGEKVEEGAEFRCEVKLSIGQETFTRVASVAVSTADVMEHPAAMAVSPETPGTVPATTESPSTAQPVTTTALPPEPTTISTHDLTTALTATREPSTETKPHSTEHPAPQDLSTGSPTAHLATATTSPGSSTATAPAEAPGTAVESTGWGTPPAEEGTGTSEGTAPACSLQIWSLPPNGTKGRALRIECHARCAGNVTVGWLQTPVALSQYRQEVVGGSSTLRLDRAEPQHQGSYRCVLLGHRSQVVSLQLMVLDDSFSTVPAIATGTTISLLGLVVTSAVSHHLWKRVRSRYELH